ncbi:MAG TPA: alpha/beta hydrolase [Steroidobacteraceae bacterium]|nr:alpha/beta hydrolase [Steroidobacteraceae bacterium]
MSVRRILAALLCALPLTACVSSILAHKIVAPPNKSGIRPLFADSQLIKRAPDAFAAQWMVDVPRPRARISVASIEPGDYGFDYQLELEYADGKAPTIHKLTAHWRQEGQVTRSAPPRGTIVLLHGYLQNKNYVVPWAIRLAQAGYRCAVVDLRAHGASTGKHISFGAFESHDLSLVIDDLGRRGWDVSRVGLLGVSYGASVALLTAGHDARVTSVVAFEPFASAETAIPELMRSAFAHEAAGISDRQFARAYVKEAKIARFDWADADIPKALSRTRAPVLFLHGEADSWLSPDHSRALLKSAPPGSRLILAPRDNHVSLPLQIEPFEKDVLAWFDAAF